MVKRVVIAVVVAAYIYFLLPATAVAFYELYHLTEFGPIYWGYSGFKAAGYYLGAYEYRLMVCIAVGLVFLMISTLWGRLRKN